MTDKKRILALSSSRVGEGGYLENAIPQITGFLGKASLQIVLIPFAYVDEDPAPLVSMVTRALESTPYVIETADMFNSRSLVEDADVIMVNGGNTFKLLHDLYQSDLLNLVKGKVKSGTPYIGWSAGANITGATIRTTNDMPIIEPESFRALGFFPFQINPHYHNIEIPGFNGETRDQRLTEFVKLNPEVPVVGLPEGTALCLQQGLLKFSGAEAGVLMTNEGGSLKKRSIKPDEDVSFLMAY